MKRVSLLLITVLALTLLNVAPVSATPPEDAAGEFVIVADDGQTTTFAVTGTFNGDVILYHSGGNANIAICEVCKVEGKTGKVIFNLVYMNEKQEKGHFNVLEASGELTGLHFTGTHERDVNELHGIYWGKIHFDPQ